MYVFHSRTWKFALFFYAILFLFLINYFFLNILLLYFTLQIYFQQNTLWNIARACEITGQICDDVELRTADGKEKRVE